MSCAQGADTGVRASALICTARRADTAPAWEERATTFEAECLLQGRKRYALAVPAARKGLYTSWIYYDGDKFVSDVTGKSEEEFGIRATLRVGGQCRKLCKVRLVGVRAFAR